MDARRRRWPRRFWGAFRDGRGFRDSPVQGLHRCRPRPRGDLLQVARTWTLRDLHRLDCGAITCCAGAGRPTESRLEVTGKIEVPSGESSKSMELYADT